ncbi:MAG: stage II sporulation protein M [Lachnospiraceae bacterium]|nr:stage II sporulation protein M [Lachnospiraceae bacterium]
MSVFLRKFKNMLFISFLAGVVVVLLFAKTSVFQEGYFSIYSLERLKYLQVDEHKLFLCILQNRIQIVLLILMTGLIARNIWVTYVFTIWYGFSFGMMASVYANHFGWKGIPLFLCCVFPQILFYIPGFYGLLYTCSARSGSESLLGGRRYLYQSALQIFCFLGVVAMGIFTESYVNPTLVTKIVTILKFL